MVDLTGKTAVVSGSSRGIGKGIAHALLGSGARVCINGRNEVTLVATAEELASEFGEDSVVAISADATTTEGVLDLLDQATSRWSVPDVVVANVGSGRSVAGWDVGDDEWERMMSLNLHGSIRLCRESIRRMPGGVITVIASIAGCDPIGAPVPYTVAKAGLLAYVKATADQVGRAGIRINSVSPGNVMFEGGTWADKLAEDRDGVLAMVEQKVPLNGFASPADIGNAVAWLSSDEARFVTGTNLVVDGGQARRML